MRRRFADSSWFIAFLSPDDDYHEAATKLAKRVGGQLITSQFKLVELVNFLSSPRVRDRVRNLMQALERDPDTTVVPEL